MDIDLLREELEDAKVRLACAYWIYDDERDDYIKKIKRQIREITREITREKSRNPTITRKS